MIVVGTTMAAFVMDQRDTWGSWLRNAEAIIASHPNVHYFAALQLDARGLEPFQPLLDELARINGSYFTYSLDDGRTEVTTANRLRHITMGQNIVTDFACAVGATHLLFLAADLAPDPDTLPKLLEMDHPLVGGEVSTYVLSGPKVDKYQFPVEEHMATAAYIMLARQVFNQLRWRWDADTGMTDDPCMHHDALHLLGIPTYVRKDCIGKHYPEAIGAIETRGHDMKVHR